MAQLVTIPFRLTSQRERTLRKELNIPNDQPLRNVQAYYAIRDTVYAWLDGGEAVIDPDPDDELGERRGFQVSERPVEMKKTLKIRRKPGRVAP